MKKKSLGLHFPISKIFQISKRKQIDLAQSFPLHYVEKKHMHATISIQK